MRTTGVDRAHFDGTTGPPRAHSRVRANLHYACHPTLCVPQSQLRVCFSRSSVCAPVAAPCVFQLQRATLFSTSRNFHKATRIFPRVASVCFVAASAFARRNFRKSSRTYRGPYPGVCITCRWFHELRQRMLCRSFCIFPSLARSLAHRVNLYHFQPDAAIATHMLPTWLLV
jgi:hypothetical protein